MLGVCRAVLHRDGSRHEATCPHGAASSLLEAVRGALLTDGGASPAGSSSFGVSDGAASASGRYRWSVGAPEKSHGPDERSESPAVSEL